MDKDQFKGRAKQAEGQLEESAGKIVGNKKMERGGKRKKAVGTVQSRYGDVKSDIKKSI
ncbi:MAG: CsbD family protein [Spirochaetaceae bacterium]|nr:MAG: CsbD family protein [Spirochaetaceae bacterium]